MYKWNVTNFSDWGLPGVGILMTSTNHKCFWIPLVHSSFSHSSVCVWSCAYVRFIHLYFFSPEDISALFFGSVLWVFYQVRLFWRCFGKSNQVISLVSRNLALGYNLLSFKPQNLYFSLKKFSSHGYIWNGSYFKYWQNKS